MPALALDIDHIGIAVRDLDRGERQLRSLGFALTPRSHHRGSPTPGAPVEPWGSANHCAMFAQGYLELVGLTDPEKYSSVKMMLASYEGAHTVAFRPESVERAHERLASEGVAVDEIRYLERMTAFGPSGEEQRRVAFKNMYLSRSVFTEARFQYTQHLTPDIMWQPRLLDHPNGAIAIVELILCSPSPADTAIKLAPATGVDPETVGPGEYRLSLSGSRLSIVSVEAWHAYVPDFPLPPLPAPVGVSFRVKSLDRTRALLQTNNIDFAERSGIWIHFNGTAIRFVE